MSSSATERVVVLRIADAKSQQLEDTLVVEAPLSIVARGKTVATVMRTPGHDLELVRGLLHAEAIEGGSRVEMVGETNEHGDGVVHVDLAPELFAQRGTISTAACGVCGRAGIDDFFAVATPVLSETSFAVDQVSMMMRQLRGSQPVFEQTGGLHAAALFTREAKLLVAREDIGRHNAVDKVVGWCLANPHQVEVGDCAMVVSGRLGYELVQKAVRLGVPLIAAVSAPSSLAVEVANRYRLCAIGFARDNRVSCYAHSWRLQVSDAT